VTYRFYLCVIVVEISIICGMNERKPLTVKFPCSMFPDLFDEFFSQITAGFGCRLCDRKRALRINKTVIYSEESGPLKRELIVKVCAMNAQVCMCTCV
jgi:hypothetical protein